MKTPPQCEIRFHASPAHIQRELARIQASWTDQERRMRAIGTRAVLADGLPQPVDIIEVRLKDIVIERKSLA